MATPNRSGSAAPAFHPVGGLPRAADAQAAEPIVISPRGTTWPGSSGYGASEFGMTRQAHWYRLRSNREHGSRNEAAGYWLKLSWYDEAGRLWQHSSLAVVDDFGKLVEVRHG